MIRANPDEPVKKGEFYSVMTTVFTFLMLVNFAADAGELLRLLLSIPIILCIFLFGFAARRRSRRQ